MQSLPEVDAERIGVIGHSLGGHNAMFTAAFDTRLKAVVSDCGFNSFPKYYGGNIAGWTSDRYMPRIASAYEHDPKKVPFDFPEVVVGFAPRAFLANVAAEGRELRGRGVKDCIAAAAAGVRAARRHGEAAGGLPRRRARVPARARGGVRVPRPVLRP